MSIFQRRGDWRYFYKTSPVTSILLIINTVFLIITLITGGFNTVNLLELGAIHPTLIELGEYWRILTAAFLHGSFLHFFSNVVIGILTLSSALERLIGSKKFSIIYFGGLTLSGIAVVAFSGNAVTIGASGAIFAVLGSLLYLTFYRRDLIGPRDSQSVRSLIIVNIIFTLLAPRISIPGHIGGIISGFLISYLVIRRNIFKVIH